MQISSRFFALQENAYVQSGCKETQLQRLYEIWTMKESYVKQDGRGLGLGLKSFDVFSLPKSNLVFHKILQNEKFVCHLCIADKSVPQISQYTVDDILQFVKKAQLLQSKNSEDNYLDKLKQ